MSNQYQSSKRKKLYKESEFRRMVVYGSETGTIARTKKTGSRDVMLQTNVENKLGRQNIDYGSIGEGQRQMKDIQTRTDTLMVYILPIIYIILLFMQNNNEYIILFQYIFLRTSELV